MDDLLIPLLIVFVGLFALRGLMLGAVHLVVRITSLISAYLTTFTFRGAAYQWLAPHVPGEWPPMLVQAGVAMVLFFTVMFVIGRSLHLVMYLLGKRWQGVAAWRENRSYSGRVTGLLLNSALGVFFALIGLWGYAIAAPLMKLPALTAQQPQLQELADKIGGGLFIWTVSKVLDTDVPAMASASAENTLPIADTDNRNRYQPDFNSGTAMIQSSEDPEKVIYVDQRDRLKQSLPRIHALDGESAHRFSSEQARELPPVNIMESPTTSPVASSQTQTGLAGNPQANQQLMEQANAMLDDPAKMQEALGRVLPPETAGQMATMLHRYLQDPKNRQAAQQQMQQMIQDPQKLQDALNNDTVKRLMGQ